MFKLTMKSTCRLNKRKQRSGLCLNFHGFVLSLRVMLTAERIWPFKIKPSPSYSGLNEELFCTHKTLVSPESHIWPRAHIHKHTCLATREYSQMISTFMGVCSQLSAKLCCIYSSAMWRQAWTPHCVQWFLLDISWAVSQAVHRLK